MGEEVANTEADMKAKDKLGVAIQETMDWVAGNPLAGADKFEEKQRELGFEIERLVQEARLGQIGVELSEMERLEKERLEPKEQARLERLWLEQMKGFDRELMESERLKREWKEQAILERKWH